MQLVLTYHRIVDGPGAVEGFFDVPSDLFARHLRQAQKAWGTGISPAKLGSHGRRAGARGGFLVTFDDGTEDHYTTAAPLLEERGFRAVFFVNTDLLGKPGYLTPAQCLELQSRGHAVESHSHEHVLLTSVSDEELTAQLCESRQRLRQAGLGQHDFLAPPGGYVDSRVTRVAAACGYRLLRTLEWGYNRTFMPLGVQSITMNQQTAGSCASVLISPYGELAKQSLYRAKELAKRFGPSVYSSLRDLKAGPLSKGVISKAER